MADGASFEEQSTQHSRESGVFTMSGSNVGKLIVLFILVFLAALMALAVWLYSTLGWIGFVVMLGVLLVGLMVIKAMIGKLLFKAVSIPFAMKGSVLKGATAQVHSVEAAPRPPREYDEDEDEPEEEYNRFYTIDVTVSPPSADGVAAFTAWEPGELFLVQMDTPSGPLHDDKQVGSVLQTQLWAEGAWTEDDGIKAPGPQRLKLLVGVKDGTRECRFRYYFEVFGEVKLPEN